jgi:hypothetical protein
MTLDSLSLLVMLYFTLLDDGPSSLCCMRCQDCIGKLKNRFVTSVLTPLVRRDVAHKYSVPEFNSK